MKTLTIEIINEKALNLLRDMALLDLIRFHSDTVQPPMPNWAERYKGAMTRQSVTDIETQLNNLRNAWE